MKIKERYCEWFKPFGPYILKTTISDELHKILLDSAYKVRENKKLKNKNDYRKKLAGNLSEEYSYSNIFTKEQEEFVDKEFTWLGSVYTKASIEALGKDLSLQPNEVSLLKPVWVNFMKSGEWNPKHTHTGDISCVTYLKVPKEISEENNKGNTSSKSNTPCAGRIEFLYGEHIDYSTTGRMIEPKEKDIYLFPARLFHSVYPFKSKTERISVSCNFANKLKSLKYLEGKGEI